MTTLRDIKKRLHSAENIQHITKAMEMVAAVRLRKALNKLDLFRPYAEKMQELLQQLATTSDPHPFYEARPVKRKGVLIVTADKGLCGAYNNNVLNAADKLLRKEGYGNGVLFLAGNKSIDYYKNKPHEIKFTLRDLAHHLHSTEVERLSVFLTQGFMAEEWDEVTVIYTHFKNILSREVRIEPLLPIPKGEINSKNSTDYIFEPNPQEIYSALMPKYFFTRIMKILSEAHVSELGARVTAMKAATKNADEMIDKLTLIRNKVRQAGITKEMLEITSGAEGLE